MTRTLFVIVYQCTGHINITYAAFLTLAVRIDGIWSDGRRAHAPATRISGPRRLRPRERVLSPGSSREAFRLRPFEVAAAMAAQALILGHPCDDMALLLSDEVREGAQG